MNDPVEVWNLAGEDYEEQLAGRVSKGFGPYDVVNLDVYLSWVISNALREFAARETGVPHDMTEQMYADKLENIAYAFEKYHTLRYEIGANITGKAWDEAWEDLKRLWINLWL